MIYSPCVFDLRYGSDEMRKIFSYANIIGKYILVEKSLVKALGKTGFIDNKCLESLEQCLDKIDLEMISGEVIETEKIVGHEITALIYVLEKRCGSCGRYIHFGATSNDIIDTSWALIIREALGLIKKKLSYMIHRLIDLIDLYGNYLMIGRTHGQHALPITLGFKLSNYIYELARSYERLCETERRVVRGKMSGAVGTMAGWGRSGLLIERESLKELDLEPHLISTQIAPRDGFAEVSLVLAILASQLDRFALEVRELSRPEINEIYETIKRIGSSTMPHKRNPVTAERISGLARATRSLASSFLENIVLMHERDLSNSSFERYSIPHLFLLIDQILIDMQNLLSNIWFNKESMIRNLESSKKTVLSERILLELIRRGASRIEAHQRLSKLSRESLEKNISFEEVLEKDDYVTKYLSKEEIKALLNYDYLGSYKELIDRTINYAKKTLGNC